MRRRPRPLCRPSGNGGKAAGPPPERPETRFPFDALSVATTLAEPAKAAPRVPNPRLQTGGSFFSGGGAVMPGRPRRRCLRKGAGRAGRPAGMACAASPVNGGPTGGCGPASAGQADDFLSGAGLSAGPSGNCVMRRKPACGVARGVRSPRPDAARPVGRPAVAKPPESVVAGKGGTSCRGLQPRRLAKAKEKLAKMKENSNLRIWEQAGKQVSR